MKSFDHFCWILFSIRQQISLYATTLQCNRYNWWKSETLFFSQVNWESYTMWAWQEFSVTIYLVWLTSSLVCYTWYSGTRLWTVAGRVVACPLSTSITGSLNKEEHIIGRTAFCAQNSWRMELDSFSLNNHGDSAQIISLTECILRSE